MASEMYLLLIFLSIFLSSMFIMALSISFSGEKKQKYQHTKQKKKTSLHFPNTRNGAWLSHEDTSSHLNGTKSNSACQKQPCVLWSQAAYAENDNSKFPPKRVSSGETGSSRSGSSNQLRAGGTEPWRSDWAGARVDSKQGCAGNIPRKMATKKNGLKF